MPAMGPTVMPTVSAAMARVWAMMAAAVAISAIAVVIGDLAVMTAPEGQGQDHKEQDGEKSMHGEPPGSLYPGNSGVSDRPPNSYAVVPMGVRLAPAAGRRSGSA